METAQRKKKSGSPCGADASTRDMNEQISMIGKTRAAEEEKGAAGVGSRDCHVRQFAERAPASAAPPMVPTLSRPRIRKKPCPRMGDWRPGGGHKRSYREPVGTQNAQDSDDDGPMTSHGWPCSRTLSPAPIAYAVTGPVRENPSGWRPRTTTNPRDQAISAERAYWPKSSRGVAARMFLVTRCQRSARCKLDPDGVLHT